MEELDEKKIDKMKVAQIKAELTKRGLPITGQY